MNQIDIFSLSCVRPWCHLVAFLSVSLDLFIFVNQLVYFSLDSETRGRIFIHLCTRSDSFRPRPIYPFDARLYDTYLASFRNRSRRISIFFAPPVEQTVYLTRKTDTFSKRNLLANISNYVYPCLKIRDACHWQKNEPASSPDQSEYDDNNNNSDDGSGTGSKFNGIGSS